MIMMLLVQPEVGPDFIRAFYKSYDDTIDLWNTKFAEPAQRIMDALRKTALITS